MRYSDDRGTNRNVESWIHLVAFIEKYGKTEDLSRNENWLDCRATPGYSNLHIVMKMSALDLYTVTSNLSTVYSSSRLTCFFDKSSWKYKPQCYFILFFFRESPQSFALAPARIHLQVTYNLLIIPSLLCGDLHKTIGTPLVLEARIVEKSNSTGYI